MELIETKSAMIDEGGSARAWLGTQLSSTVMWILSRGEYQWGPDWCGVRQQCLSVPATSESYRPNGVTNTGP
jgi:hypothetical protein